MNLKIKKLLFIFFIEGFLFYSTIVLGILCALRLEKILESQKIEYSLISPLKFIFYFFLATFFIFLIFRFLKRKTLKKHIYKILFLLVSFFSSLIFLEAFFPEPISLILTVSLILWWIKTPIVLNQNLLMIFSLSGIGASLGLVLRPEAVVLILIILSIYDFVAVYTTKHMVKIAKDMVETGTILGLVFPLNLKSFLKITEEIKPGKGDFLILGGGDIALPLIFSVSVLKFGAFKSLVISFFSLLGFFINLLLFISQKEKKPMPALPLISLFSIIGYLIFL